MTQHEFALLVDEHRTHMRNLAHQKLRNFADAEDAVQDALLSLWRQVEKLDASMVRGPFWSLAKRATLAAVTDIVRERVGRDPKKPGGREHAEAVYASRQGPRFARDGLVQGLEPDELVELHDALSLMPPEYVAVLVDVYIHRLKIAHVARERGDSPDALRQKLHRLKRDMRAALLGGCHETEVCSEPISRGMRASRAGEVASGRDSEGAAPGGIAPSSRASHVNDSTSTEVDQDDRGA